MLDNLVATLFLEPISTLWGLVLFSEVVLKPVLGSATPSELDSGIIVGGLDVAVAVIYILVVVGIGCWAGIRGNRQQGEAKEYFLAGGTLRWPVIGLALFATNISCVHLVSLAQSGFDTGLLNGNFEWMAAFTLILLGLFFAPFYFRSQVATLPDFLERRYSRACRDWLALLSVVSAVTIHIGFSFLTGGLVLEELFGLNMYASIVVIAVLTGLYTIIGGLLAVVITEAIQTIVLVLGAGLITWFAWDKMGGWDAMVQVLEDQGQTEKLSMLRPHGDADGLPWYAVFLGYPVLGIWYWCADQTIVQRVLGARSEHDARTGPLFAGLIKILPVFIFVLPGLLAYTLAQSGKLDLSAITSVNEAGEEIVNSKGIYAVMITQLMPPGLIGVMVAALLAALMSTVAGALNSISTLCSFDLYKRFKPNTSDRELVLVGRITAGVALLLAIGLVPVLNRFESIFNGLNTIIAHIAPPVTTVFVLGVFWKRASARSAEVTLLLGSLLGAGVFFVNLTWPENPLAQIPFMMIAFYLLVVCVAIQVTTSLLYPATVTPSQEALCWSSPLEPLRTGKWSGVTDHRLLASVLIVIMGILYYLFR